MAKTKTVRLAKARIVLLRKILSPHRAFRLSYNDSANRHKVAR